jgi:hypothetical protein
VYFAVLRLYVNGMRVQTAKPEVWGELTVGRDNSTQTVRACLRAPGSTRHDDWLMPPLFDVAVARCSLDVLALRGIERVKNAWHLQVWSCRFATSHEIQTATRTDHIGFDVMHAQYRHWWPRLVSEVRQKDPNAYVVSVQEARQILEVSLDEMWPFIKWIGDKPGIRFAGRRRRDGDDCSSSVF